MHVRSASGVSCKGSLELERQSRTGGGEDQQRCGEGGVVGGVTGLRGGEQREGLPALIGGFYGSIVMYRSSGLTSQKSLVLNGIHGTSKLASSWISTSCQPHRVISTS